MTQLPTTPHPPQFLHAHPVDKITPHPRNARAWNRDAIRESLEDNSQYKPVVVQRSTNHILAGNGTFTVATEDLGWDVIDVYVVDVDDTTALRILLADNKIPDGSTYLVGPLADLLAELADLPDGLQGTGYDQQDLDALLADVDQEAATAMGSPPPGAPADVGHDREPRDRDDDRDDDDRVPTDREPAPRAAGSDAADDPDAQVMVIRLPFTPEDHQEYSLLAEQGREMLGEVPTAQVVLRALRVLAVLSDWGPQLTDDQATALTAIGVPVARP